MGKTIKEFTKARFRLAYDIARAAHHGAKESKSRKNYERQNNVCHVGNVSTDSKLAKLFVGTNEKRLNIVMKTFSKERLQEKDISELLKLATTFSVKNNYSLRIISRNNLPNPKIYQDFLKDNNLKSPSSISFYTDSASRVAMPTYRLEVTKGDIFFGENELKEIKEFIKNEK